MTKTKSKGGGKLFQGKENFQRMNFLYQAAHVVAQCNINGDLAAYYGNSMLSTAQKSVLKIEPDVKRDLCKGCGNLLKPGFSAKVRLRSENLIWTCLLCGTIKRYPTKRGYKLWIEQKEACLDVIEISNSSEEVKEREVKVTGSAMSDFQIKQQKEESKKPSDITKGNR